MRLLVYIKFLIFLLSILKAVFKMNSSKTHYSSVFCQCHLVDSHCLINSSLKTKFQKVGSFSYHFPPCFLNKTQKVAFHLEKLVILRLLQEFMMLMLFFCKVRSLLRKQCRLFYQTLLVVLGYSLE